MPDVPERIEVRGLEALVLCGVLPEEQARKQPFSFDLDLYLDLGPAGRSDDLTLTVDYGDLAGRIADTLDHESFLLLEAMAARVADLALEYPLVDEVTVVARKMRPPVPQHVATTGVRVHRRRADADQA